MSQVARTLLICAVYAILPALGRPALAAQLDLPPPGRDGWRPMTFHDIDRHTSYTPVHVDGLDAVHAVSDCSASALVYPLQRLDLRAMPRLRFRWRVDQPLRIGGVRVKRGDDFAARVYVIFRFQPERASRWQRWRHAVLSKLHGTELPGNAINYVWSSAEPAGAHWDNPFAGENKMMSLGDGALSRWRRMDVDVVADYEALFGHAPPEPLAVALMTDSDNSCQKAEAYFAGFRFSGADSGEPARPPAEGP